MDLSLVYNMSVRPALLVLAIYFVVCYKSVESISVSAKRHGNELGSLEERKRDGERDHNKRDSNSEGGRARDGPNKGDLVTFKQETDRDTSASASSNGRGYPGYYASNPGSEYGYVTYEGGAGYYGDKGSGEAPGHSHGNAISGLHGFGHEAHSLDHHGHYSGGHFDHHDHGDHGDHGHGHQDHGITLKGFLIPFAGLALLGAAAALVSNPILLQLGVVSGRRRRRSVGGFGFMQNQPSSVSDFILNNTQMNNNQVFGGDGSMSGYDERHRRKKDLKYETNNPHAAHMLAYKKHLVEIGKEAGRN